MLFIGSTARRRKYDCKVRVTQKVRELLDHKNLKGEMPDMFKDLDQADLKINGFHTDPNIPRIEEIVRLKKDVKCKGNKSPSKGLGNFVMACIQAAGISGGDCPPVANLVRTCSRARVTNRPNPPDPNGSSNFSLDNIWI